MYKPIKELGQNFLMDFSMAHKMVDALDIQSGDLIVEIGPGHGVLTEIVAQKVRGTGSKLLAVELDERFVAKLDQMFLNDPNIQIVHQDVLDFLPEFESEIDFKIIGSLPYYITSPIIHKIIKMKKMPKSCVLMIQKEVAEKISSSVPDSSYMSSFVQTFFDVEYLGEVPRKVFKPEPEVDGGILLLSRKEGGHSLDFIEKYEGFLHKGFSNPRKMLNKAFSKEELEKGNIDSSLRAQNLGAKEWLEFYNILNTETL